MIKLPIEIVEQIYGYLSLDKAVELIFGIKKPSFLLKFQFVDFLWRMAIQVDNISLIKWLVRNKIQSSLNVIDLVADKGNLETLKWLSRFSVEICTSDAMDYAAREGHLDIIKWLHFNRTEGCTKRAMNYAAREGHLDIVKWLHINRNEGCSTYAMNWACSYGHLEMVKWLHYNRREGCTKDAYVWASEYGHFEVAQWLQFNRPETALNSKFGITYGHQEVEISF
jgi:hypothetical protein